MGFGVLCKGGNGLGMLALLGYIGFGEVKSALAGMKLKIRSPDSSYTLGLIY